MAKGFEGAVGQITEIRQQKAEIARSLYKAKQAMISNQYLLRDTVNQSKDGRHVLDKIDGEKRTVESLEQELKTLEQSERDMLRSLQETFGTQQDLVNQLNDQYPILFFPLRIETAFSDNGTQLFVRVFPDDIAIDTHEEDLTESEINEGMNYWRAYVAADNMPESIQAWDLLCRSFGAERAAWVALQMKPTNLVLNPLPDDLIFPVHTPKSDSWSKQPTTDILPDAFVIYAYANDGSTITFQTNDLPDKLKMGIDPTLDPDTQPMSFDQQTESGREHELVANADVDWMIDFDAAIAKGMGARLPITNSQLQSGFKKILVLGVKASLTTQASKDRLEELIDGHHYTDGFSLLKQGTSTNNTDTEYAGYSFKEFGNPTTFKTETGEDPLFTPVTIQRQKTDGQLLCEALGIEYDLLYHIFESDGLDISNAMNMNNMLYQASVGYTVNELMPIFDTRSVNNTQLKQFFTDFVRSRGALPSIRSGTQPYGILPASVYSRIDWGTDPNAGLYRRLFDYTSALDTHWANAIASVETQGINGFSLSDSPSTATVQQLSDILSQHALSTEYVQRIGVGAGYVWNNLEYAAGSYPNLRDDWNNQEMDRMEQIISGSGLPLNYSHKAVQMNYLENQSTVSIPLVADADTPLDAPLPNIGGKYNMLQLLYNASFDQLRDENYEEFGIPPDKVEGELWKNLLYRISRQSLMLEYYEAACEILKIEVGQRGEHEFVNIGDPAIPPSFGHSMSTSGEVGPMGPLTQGSSRLLLMATPYGEYESIGSYLSSDDGLNDVGAKNLLDAKVALNEMASVHVRELNLLTAGVMDSVSFRLDTWRLALVNQRLNALRGIQEGSGSRNKGIYLGAYGWVTDVKKATNLVAVPTPDAQFQSGIVHDQNNKGYVHAPSINQAVTGAVMLSGYTGRANANMEDPLSINLSSERVRAALDIMDAIRNGQDLSVLLGYEFERRLREIWVDALPPVIDINTAISNLRKYYPINRFVVEVTIQPDIVDKVKARNVVNGVKLIEIYKENDNDITTIANKAEVTGDLKEILEKAVKWIWNLMDAIGDIAMSEGLFHVVQGNPVKGGAIADAISKGNLVADPDILDSIKSGLEVNQRLTLHFEAEQPFDLPNDWNQIDQESKRAKAEPYVNKWLCGMLPTPSSIICDVLINDDDVVHVSALDLWLQPIDLMYIVGEELNNDDAMLSLTIKSFVRRQFGIGNAENLEIIYGPSVAENEFSFEEVLPILLYARRVLTASRPLDTHDYMVPEEADGVMKIYEINELANRLSNASGELEVAGTQLENVMAAPFDYNGFIDALYALSWFGIEQTVYGFPNDHTPEGEAVLQAWAASVLSVVQTRLANSTPINQPLTGEDPLPFVNSVTECMKSIFGNAFVTIPLFGIRAEEKASLALMLNNGSLLEDNPGNELLTDTWLSSIARVRQNAANFEMLNLLSNAINSDGFGSREILPLQLPYASDGTERWLGAAVNPDNPVGLKEGRVAIGSSMPNGAFDPNQNQAGLLIDDWIDVIPARQQTTGVSFHHNQPNAKAPQCLILGLTPKITGNWKWVDLVDMMNETLDLAKKRAVDYEHISPSVVGQFPGMMIPFTQNGNVIGLSAGQVLSINP